MNHVQIVLLYFFKIQFNIILTSLLTSLMRIPNVKHNTQAQIGRERYKILRRDGGKVISPTLRPPLPPRNTLLLIFLRGWIEPRTIVRPEGLSQWHILLLLWCRTAGYKSVSGRSCDRPSRHRFFLVFLGPRANAEMVSAFPSCLYMLFM